MEESSEPKVYPPSQKKLKDLLKKGQFPKTELLEPVLDVIAFVMLLSIFCFFLFEYFESFIEHILTKESLSESWTFVYDTLCLFIALLVIIKIVLSLSDWVMVNKSSINTESLGFKIENINPVNGFKNIFGLEAISKSLRKLFELSFLLFLIFYISGIIDKDLDSLKDINNYTYWQFTLFYYVGMVLIFYIVYGICVGSIDYAFEVYHFKKKNRMTFTEMKNELKETEGSPEIKSERKRLMQEVMDTPITKGRRPDFAIANPTHILVPICYDRNIDKAPVILQIYTEDRALERRKYYEENNIPIFEHVPLARAFYYSMGSGNEYVPKMFYQHVAIIIAALKRKNNKK
ncbi:EscU/YscU/HrcU family type III secretion system export apparatus switch protein [Vibrio coralliilyticus]|uniref:EscU/YscU/HrcU family type III secretion system export apparatus switch protein n=1 Tax=Vibrio coralliilyticus TaxID=190893 RepID=UPI0017B1F6F6|nr:EscU/YscU/HrcU family type III secretion system export apparatus switch protein [Vibrio coralliilyticus]NUW68062.1 EscU/YscU/HrcU family type III secretion system export apparatus switch protein [Vibrio coralliilyticus]